jgi:glycosyltransferase involved in cell wall biosynthesis
MDHERLGKISVFFPMWNEEEYINRAVDAAREACKELIEDGEVSDYEILIVDDASTDATPRIADELADADPHVRVVHHPKNRKLGGSVKTGFTESKGDLVLYTDADLPFDMAEVKRACRLLRIYEADLVSAYRFDRTGEGFVRVIYSAIYNLLVRAFFGVRVRDVNFAFKLVRRSVLDGMALTSEGSFIDAELIVRTVKSGKQMVQFGVDYFPRTRGVSTLSSPAVIVKILQEMMQLRGELRSIEAA